VASKHAIFLQACLKENAGKFADVQVSCSDGTIRQNRIFLGLMEAFLQKLPEFCSPDLEVLVILPEISVQEYLDILNYNIFYQTKSVIEDNGECSEYVSPGPDQDGFYDNTEDYVEISRIGMTENNESLEIIMHDDMIVSEEREVVCGVCQSIVKENLLNQHLKLQCKKFQCNHCDKRFAREKAFLAHKSNYHNEQVEVEAGKKPLLACTFCTAKFEAPVQLEKHIRRHTKTKPYQCEVCTKSFVSKSNLSAHQRLHEGTALRYSCTECDKKFSHPSEVKQHMVVHTGIRAYTCSKCGNKYSRYPSLWKHMKKCSYTNKTVVLVKPLCHQPNNTAELVKPSESDIMFVRKNDLISNEHELEEESVESVVVDEIIVADNIGNDLILADDSFSLESAL